MHVTEGLAVIGLPLYKPGTDLDGIAAWLRVNCDRSGGKMPETGMDKRL
jgi:hypothetical protein